MAADHEMIQYGDSEIEGIRNEVIQWKLTGRGWEELTPVVSSTFSVAGNIADVPYQIYEMGQLRFITFDLKSGLWTSFPWVTTDPIIDPLGPDWPRHGEATRITFIYMGGPLGEEPRCGQMELQADGRASLYVTGGTNLMWPSIQPGTPTKEVHIYNSVGMWIV